MIAPPIDVAPRYRSTPDCHGPRGNVTIASMTATITVDERFCGPPDSGNGGYVCGCVARYVAGDAEVTLRRPPPLGRALVVDGAGAGTTVTVRDGDAVVAEAVATTVAVDAPPPVAFADAERAAAGSPFLRGTDVHPFPTCFVCGPQRAPADGLRLFATAVAGRDVVAAAWVPDDSLPRSDADDALVADEIVWAALDCPGCFSMYLDPPLDPPYVLGRLAARVDAPVRIGGAYVVVGWRVAVEGRKLFAGSALYEAGGDVVAVARSTWVQLAPAA
jgi:hypothetical protein